MSIRTRALVSSAGILLVATLACSDDSRNGGVCSSADCLAGAAGKSGSGEGAGPSGGNSAMVSGGTENPSGDAGTPTSGKGGTPGDCAAAGSAGAPTAGAAGSAGEGPNGGSAGAGGSQPGAGTGGTASGGMSGAGAGGAALCPQPPQGLPSGGLTRYANNPIVRNGPQSYDSAKAGPRVVRREGLGDYRMWYEAVADDLYTGVAYATSNDGLTWTKQGLVMQPTETWEGNEVSPQSIVREGNTYKLFYHAGGIQQSHRNVGYATSTDGGMTWDRRTQPVLVVGAQGAFDDDEAAEPRVFKLESGYRMYYTGKNEATERKSLGVASSSDGIAWTKPGGNPILDTNRWGNFWGGAFFFDGDRWHLWHAVENGGGEIHYKWSLDGLTWTDGTTNPVLRTANTANGPDTVFLGDSVSGFRDGDVYRVMYTGYASNLFGTDGRFEGICSASVAAACPLP